MNKTINPKFESCNVTTEWNSNDHPEWWAKDVEIHIRDIQNEGGALQDYEVGEVFNLLVCSPEFKRQPNAEFDADNLSKALVLNVYNKDQVEAYLKKNIDSLGTVDIEAFDRNFRALFDMSDWDQIDEVLR